MRQISLEDIKALQKNTKNIRNICILAHVDHGKTTLADCLIASNGIISSRLAGKLRYMDNRPDEQQRGITMKSSAISLHYAKDGENFLINLIDSPGHIDFSSEVSTAVRLCDGALVLVDAVEGVCPQTHAVLRQAWLENIHPCLVLNKVDRLITELKLSPLEAYFHMQQILEQVNAVTASLFTSKVMEQNTENSEANTENKQNINDDQVYDWDSGLIEADDSSIYFSPEQGNVIFASAVDGWAFGISEFVTMYSKKLGVKSEILAKTLWGDYYLNTKTKRIMKGAQAKGKKPLFVQFILDNLWTVYDAILEKKDKDRIDKIVSSLGLKLSARDTRHTDPRSHLQAVLRQWLPLSDAILGMVSVKHPSPLSIPEERIEKLMSGGLKKFDSLPTETQQLKIDFQKCSVEEGSPVIAFVSKMFSVSQDALPKHRRRPLTQDEIEKRREIVRQKHLERQNVGKDTESETDLEENSQTFVSMEKPDADGSRDENEEEDEEEVFIAFARVFSGSLKKGMKLYVLGPKYDPAKGLNLKKESEGEQSFDVDSIGRETNESGFDTFDDADVTKHMSLFEVGDLYLMMGRELENLEEVPTGNIVAINGLRRLVLKSATLSSSLACPAFTPMPFEARPIVRVAIEPKQPSELPSLVRGLKLLNQADPCVRVLIQETGEYVIVTAGEVHLQRCLDDLRSRYAGIEIAVSPPITPFRETVVEKPKVDMVNEEITNQSASLHIQRLPAFMLREIQAWNDTITKAEDATQGLVDEISKEELKWLKQVDEKKANFSSDVGLIEAKTANKQCCVALKAVSLPRSVTKLLEANPDLIKTISHVSAGVTFMERKELRSTLTTGTLEKIKEFYTELKKAFEEAGQYWKNALNAVWAFGPRGMGPNILLNRVRRYKRRSIWNGLVDEETDTEAASSDVWENDNSVVSGFQLATISGPMCEEPMMGVCFVVENWQREVDSVREKTVKGGETDSVSKNESENDTVEKGATEADQDDSNDSKRTAGDIYGPLSGQLISAVKEGCRRAFMSQPMRLMAAMYSCEIQATSDVLGKVYAVLGKREGRVLSEDMKEGTDIFNITSVLPVAESFGFCEEIRKKTSGLASPQLVFSHWEAIDVDPFWIPTTEEEYELYGSKADSENQALKYVLSVRKRKGLYVEEKVVEFAEKQRTLKKNK